MEKIVKGFYEFINESLKSKCDIKTEELWNISGENQQKFTKIMSEYIEKNLDVKSFLDRFSERMLESLVDAIKENNEDVMYDEPEKDEDGYVTSGFNLSDIESFDFDIDDDDEFGEYGITFFYNLKNNHPEYEVYAFNGELNLTRTELGNAIIDTFDRLYKIAFDATEKGKYADYAEAKDTLDTYQHITKSNGWATA